MERSTRYQEGGCVCACVCERERVLKISERPITRIENEFCKSEKKMRREGIICWID